MRFSGNLTCNPDEKLTLSAAAAEFSTVWRSEWSSVKWHWLPAHVGGAERRPRAGMPVPLCSVQKMRPPTRSRVVCALRAILRRPLARAAERRATHCQPEMPRSALRKALPTSPVIEPGKAAVDAPKLGRTFRFMGLAQFPELQKLPQRQKLKLAEELWRAAVDDTLPVSPRDRALLDARWKKYRAGNVERISLEELERRAARK